MPTSTPILGAARGAHGEQHDLQVGGAVAIAPLGSARPTNHVLLHLKGCAAAHATRAAHLTSSSPAPSGAPVRTRHRTTRAASRDPKPFVRWSVGVRIGTGWRWWSMTAPGTGRSCARPRPPENSPPVCASAGDVRRRAGVGATRRGGALHGRRSTSQELSAHVERLDLLCQPVCNVVLSILWRTFRDTPGKQASFEHTRPPGPVPRKPVFFAGLGARAAQAARIR